MIPPDRKHPTMLGLAVLGLFASPAAAAWVAAAGLPARTRRLTRAAAVTITGALALGALFIHLRAVLVALAWSGFAAVGTLVVIVLARGGSTRDEADPGEDAEPGEGRSRVSLRAIPIAVLAVAPLVMFARFSVAASVGWLLVRLDPASGDPSQLLGSIVLGAFLAMPAAAVFAVLSLRRGRLLNGADVTRAALAWFWVLALFELVVSTSLRALTSLMLPADHTRGWGGAAVLLLHLCFAVAAVPLTLALAWGSGTGLARGLRVAAVSVAGLVNLGLCFGMSAGVQFALARALERSGRVEAALGWYGRSLVGRSTPEVESWLQHRIGLLDHELGRDERAAAAFRLVETSRDANRDLVAESTYYLARLANPTPAHRVVLPGTQVRTELRASYCAPNTLALVLGFWGARVLPGEIGEEVALIGSGTSASDIRFLCDRLGFDHLLVPFATVEDLRWLVEHGIPALVYRTGHVLSVFGYDDRLGTLVAYDTATWDTWVDEPIPDFVEQWGGTQFLLGVVLPRGASTPGVEAARQRFAGPRAEAAWRWWLALEEPYSERGRGQLRKALTADPSFYPAVFALSAPAARPWLESHTDLKNIAEGARRGLDREHAPVSTLAPPLAQWLLDGGALGDLAHLATDLERRGQLDPVRETAGIGAARTGDWGRAAFLLGGVSEPEDGQTLRARTEALVALGRDGAAEAAAELAGGVADDSLDRAMVLVEEFGAERGPVYLEGAYRAYVADRPGDVARQLRFAEVSLEALAAEGGKQRRERLQQARRAATFALALAAGAVEEARAGTLLARVAVESGARSEH